MILTMDELINEAQKKSGIVVGVPSPEDPSSIKTVIRAKKELDTNFILCGDKQKITALLLQFNGNLDEYEIIAASSQEESARKVVALGRQGKVHVLLKGYLATAMLMKPVLDRDQGLRTGNLLSDIMIIENPADDVAGLLGLSDGGLNILPDLEQKKQIIENAVNVYHRLGYSDPKVGIMAAIESVKEAMPATVDAAELTEMNHRGEITGCQIYGPLALDIAVSKLAAQHKGITDPVAGRVEIMIVPNIEAGNLFGKSFTYYLKKTAAHVVMGATIPILIPSRNESEIDKFHSVALGVIIAKH